jgi:hypothetical protein
MLALWWPEARLQAESKRSRASLGKSGSVAPALQRGKAPSRGLGRENFPDNIGLVQQCNGRTRVACYPGTQKSRSWRAALPFIPSLPFSILFKSGLSSFLAQAPCQSDPGELSIGNG